MARTYQAKSRIQSEWPPCAGWLTNQSCTLDWEFVVLRALVPQLSLLSLAHGGCRNKAAPAWSEQRPRQVSISVFKRTELCTLLPSLLPLPLWQLPPLPPPPKARMTLHFILGWLQTCRYGVYEDQHMTYLCWCKCPLFSIAYSALFLPLLFLQYADVENRYNFGKTQIRLYRGAVKVLKNAVYVCANPPPPLFFLFFNIYKKNNNLETPQHNFIIEKHWQNEWVTFPTGLSHQPTWPNRGLPGTPIHARSHARTHAWRNDHHCLKYYKRDAWRSGPALKFIGNLGDTIDQLNHGEGTRFSILRTLSSLSLWYSSPFSAIIIALNIIYLFFFFSKT